MSHALTAALPAHVRLGLTHRMRKPTPARILCWLYYWRNLQHGDHSLREIHVASIDLTTVDYQTAISICRAVIAVFSAMMLFAKD